MWCFFLPEQGDCGQTGGVLAGHRHAKDHSVSLEVTLLRCLGAFLGMMSVLVQAQSVWLQGDRSRPASAGGYVPKRRWDELCLTANTWLEMKDTTCVNLSSDLSLDGLFLLCVKCNLQNVVKEKLMYSLGMC